MRRGARGWGVDEVLGRGMGGGRGYSGADDRRREAQLRGKGNGGVLLRFGAVMVMVHRVQPAAGGGGDLAQGLGGWLC